MRCAFCKWQKIDIGCKARKGNIVGLSCRTCSVIHPIKDTTGLLITGVKGRMPDRLLRHDGKEWFSKAERKDPKTVIVCITKDMLK